MTAVWVLSEANQNSRGYVIGVYSTRELAEAAGMRFCETARGGTDEAWEDERLVYRWNQFTGYPADWLELQSFELDAQPT